MYESKIGMKFEEMDFEEMAASQSQSDDIFFSWFSFGNSCTCVTATVSPECV